MRYGVRGSLESAGSDQDVKVRWGDPLLIHQEGAADGPCIRGTVVGGVGWGSRTQWV